MLEHISFLISFYEFSKRYAKLKSVSFHYLKQNFRKIRYILENLNTEERMFWLTE